MASLDGRVGRRIRSNTFMLPVSVVTLGCVAVSLMSEGMIAAGRVHLVTAMIIGAERCRCHMRSHRALQKEREHGDSDDNGPQHGMLPCCAVKDTPFPRVCQSPARHTVVSQGHGKVSKPAHSLAARSRRALAITDTEERLIAAAASIGESSMPMTG